MPAHDHIKDVLNATQKAFNGGALHKLKLGGYYGPEPELKSIEVKKITVKTGDKYSFTYHYKTRDIIKNFVEHEALTLLKSALQNQFRSAQFKSTDFDLSFEKHGEKTRLKRTEATQKSQPDTQHNRAKNHPIAQTNKPWLKALGLTGKDGKVLNKAQDKFRQINKMVEIFAPLIEAIRAEQPLIVDMGAGKGYLDFALADYQSSVAKRETQIVGVEMRQHLVDDGNANAKASGFDLLRFETGSILDFDVSGAHAVIALHACDTATDDAIFKGIQADAQLIAVAPCCHKQIRQDMAQNQSDTTADYHPDPRLESVLRHGTFMERQAEMVTDSLRALFMESRGYRVKVFEFVSDAHTPKNILIVAQKDGRKGRNNDEINQQIVGLKTLYGIKHHHLEKLLGL